MRVSGSITATAATVAETCGKWNDGWSNLDQRQKAKGANDVAEDAAGDPGADEPGLFGGTGVAAE